MSDKSRILIVDDEEITLENLEHVLKKEGYEVAAVSSGMQALKHLEASPFDLVLTDLKMKKVDGMEILEKVKQRHPDTEVIMITGYATVSSAIEAMKKGAFHYVAKPFKLDEIRLVVARAIKKKRLQDENRELKQQLTIQGNAPLIIGKSKSILEIKRLIQQIAPSDCNVIITGESGTGKELVAQSIHHYSLRATKRFVAVNCGAFTEELLANELFGHEKEAFTGALSTKIGLLETANGGTVFLDEVGDMPPSMQVKLMRVIQEKEVIRLGGTNPIPIDVRFIAATNKDLKKTIEEGAFRQDLYYRLNVVSLQMPTLMERKEDIPLLTYYFLDKYARAGNKAAKEISLDVLEILTSYSYPGNVRELENIMERAVALAGQETIELKDLPFDLQQMEIHTFRRRENQLLTLKEREKEYIQWILQQMDGNKSRTAEVLGIDRVSLWRKLKKYGLE
ncbi:MAG: sigma-54 dependent transcriptional regulator [Thermodesulfobacteriota bacterium]|nr:sigma-54 dependent transcriptional regulator [Thermodesulfobacteriota bacterium]